MKKRHDKRTPARHAWLLALAKDPHSQRFGRAGFDCMAFGLTRWRIVEGKVDGEELTESGQRVLKEWGDIPV